MIRRVVAVIALQLIAFVAFAPAAGAQQPAFDHASHAKLFVGCNTCHAGIERPGGAVFPPTSACVTCHDGTVHQRANWQPRVGPRISNLRFDHAVHATGQRRRGDTTGSCTDCHADRGASWMQVRAPNAPQCITCHTKGAGSHFSMPDSTCGTCHVPLARATTVTSARIAHFPAPPSHRAPGFISATGHGAAAKQGGTGGTAAQSCATCHAREFCAACHVNAPETTTIQALELDRRSLVLPHVLKAPASHVVKGFETGHGSAAARSPASCQTCHTRESCLTCHQAAAPSSVRAMFAAGPGRAAGAQTTRRAPASHIAGWSTHHASVASASVRSCTSCHARSECLACHKPDPGARGSYHPGTFLTRHPADAYARSSSCTDCHNTGQFCQSCHQQSGLTARRTLLGVSGYHDGNRQFGLGHGQAARQSLESCVSCHVERDCLTCHSVVKGRSFNPHGPGFNPEQLLKKNPQLCMACHGLSIPSRRASP